MIVSGVPAVRPLVEAGVDPSVATMINAHPEEWQVSDFRTTYTVAAEIVPDKHAYSNPGQESVLSAIPRVAEGGKNCRQVWEFNIMIRKGADICVSFKNSMIPPSRWWCTAMILACNRFTLQKSTLNVEGRADEEMLFLLVVSLLSTS